jgi:hypothetical protein
MPTRVGGRARDIDHDLDMKLAKQDNTNDTLVRPESEQNGSHLQIEERQALGTKLKPRTVGGCRLCQERCVETEGRGDRREE